VDVHLEQQRSVWLQGLHVEALRRDDGISQSFRGTCFTGADIRCGPPQMILQSVINPFTFNAGSQLKQKRNSNAAQRRAGESVRNRSKREN
jgi:hypothetical protein